MVKYLDEIQSERLKIDIEPVRLQIISEPYIVFGRFGYQIAFNVWLSKKKRESILLSSAISLSSGIEQLMKASDSNSYIGLEFWVQKESDNKMSKYIVSE